MSENKQLVIKQTQTLPENYIPSQQDWNFMVQWGTQAIKTGLLPSSVKNAEAAALIILKGRELGLPFMVSIAHLHVINGKPAMSAELMQTMARKSGILIQPGVVSDTSATCEILRPEPGSKWYSSTFSLDDAKKAGLLSNSNWTKYPKAMLWARAVSAGLRLMCPEALVGASYTPEELGKDVNEAGDVIETTGKHIAPIDEAKAENAATGQPGVLKPFIPPDVTVRINQIKYLQSELKLSEINFKDLLFTVHGLETLKGLTLIQYDQIISHLIELIEDKHVKPVDKAPLNESLFEVEQSAKENMDETR